QTSRQKEAHSLGDLHSSGTGAARRAGLPAHRQREDGMSGRRFDVTAIQAVSSMLAALTGAVAASSLGIAGTIVGAGLMSRASTGGAAVSKHYTPSGNERLRSAAATLAPPLDPAGTHRGSAHPDGDTAATTTQEPAGPAPQARTTAQLLASADRD